MKNTVVAAMALLMLAAVPASAKSGAKVGVLDCDVAALTRLLNALVGVGLLNKDKDTFSNTEVAATYLTQSSPNRFTGYIKYSNEVAWKLWGNLEGAVREGTHRWQETFGWEGPIFANFFKTEGSLREFLMGMNGFGQVPHLAPHLNGQRRFGD